MSGERFTITRVETLALIEWHRVRRDAELSAERQYREGMPSAHPSSMLYAAQRRKLAAEHDARMNELLLLLARA